MSCLHSQLNTFIHMYTFTLSPPNIQLPTIKCWLTVATSSDAADTQDVYAWQQSQEAALWALKETGMSDEQVIKFINRCMSSFHIHLVPLSPENTKPLINQNWNEKMQIIQVMSSSPTHCEQEYFMTNEAGSCAWSLGQIRSYVKYIRCDCTVPLR